MDDCGGWFARRADAFDYGIQRQAARTSLSLGGLAVLNAGAAVANSTVVAAAGYVQLTFQSVIDKLNALLNSLRIGGNHRNVTFHDQP